MRYGIISDTHIGKAGKGCLPDWIVEALTGVDLILHAGDLIDPGLVATLEALAPVCAVRGNMDNACRDLPLEREIPLDGTPGSIVIAHRPETLQRALGHHTRPGTIVAIHGHTHLAEFRRIGNFWVLNPGSPTHPRGGQCPSVAVLTIAEDGTPVAEFKYPPDCADE